MSDTAAPEKKQIVGTCEEISEKNGWTSFAIDVGSQYPVRLSTKLPALVEAGRAVGQATATWTFKESQGKENPNKPGTFYTNRYFDSVEEGAHAAPSAGGTAPTAHYDPIAQADKDRTITRMACLKAAASLLQGASFEGEGQRIAAWMAAAAAAERYVYRDIDSSEPDDADNIPF